MNLKKILALILIPITILLLVVALVPKWKLEVKSWWASEAPKVLSAIEKDFFNDGRVIVFAKIKSHKGLFIEIYEKVSDGTVTHLDKIQLPDEQDGFFHYRGQATNLALEDLDGDGIPEVLAPTFDENHVAHLNVYTYNSGTKKFEMLPPSVLDN
jgi:hypothetical protein